MRESDLSAHDMHSEWFSVPLNGGSHRHSETCRWAGGRGGNDDATRARDAAAEGLSAGSGETKLFILPGYRFKVVERLITNFTCPSPRS